MNEIEKARKIQEDCIKNHLIPPVLGILKVEKLNTEKEIIDSIEQKSNSYVRNAYNFIGQSLLGGYWLPTNDVGLGYSESTFGFKNMGGAVARYGPNEFGYAMRDIRVGSNPQIDKLDDFALLAPINNLILSNVTHRGSLINKKLSMEIKRTFVNVNASSIIVGETGIFSSADNQAYILIRDVFNPITLNQFEGVTITYVLELLYP